MKNRFRFKLWEVLVLFFATGTFSLSAFFYFSDISLRKYLLGWEEEEVGQERVAVLKGVRGSIKRQLSEETEFKAVGESVVLYNYDTIVTGPDGAGTILLDDGGTLELA
ncbi:MAG: hypothetical protein AAB425_08695, partial [Bdellovibrionota bacterium]